MSFWRCRLKHPGFVLVLRSDQLGETEPLADGTSRHSEPTIPQRPGVQRGRPHLLVNCNTQQLRYVRLAAPARTLKVDRGGDVVHIR